MNHPSYLFNCTHSKRYTFTSLGKQEIEKVVEFIATSIKDLYNVGFGDLLADGTMDDMVNSNNGDIAKVLATVVQILKTFTTVCPAAKVGFMGSTDERTKLYRRILRTYYDVFSKEFTITALILPEDAYVEVAFDPTATIEYHAFFIKRIV